MEDIAVSDLEDRSIVLKNLMIVGAGGFGREVLSWLPEIESYQKEWTIAGFLDDNLEALKTYNYNYPIIGKIQNYQPEENDIFVMAITSPTQRKLMIAQDLMQRGAEFISLIHPSAVFGNNNKIGKGCVICHNTIITCDVKIGDFVTMNIMSVVGHDAFLGDGCTLYAFANVNGFAQIGRGVEIGSHGSVLPGARVGDFAKVGAGSVVMKSVKESTTVVGVPAKKLLSYEN